jgi:hypothetical protein
MQASPKPPIALVRSLRSLVALGLTGASPPPAGSPEEERGVGLGVVLRTSGRAWVPSVGNASLRGWTWGRYEATPRSVEATRWSTRVDSGVGTRRLDGRPVWTQRSVRGDSRVDPCGLKGRYEATRGSTRVDSGVGTRRLEGRPVWTQGSVRGDSRVDPCGLVKQRSAVIAIKLRARCEAPIPSTTLLPPGSPSAGAKLP